MQLHYSSGYNVTIKKFKGILRCFNDECVQKKENIVKKKEVKYGIW